LKTVSVLKGEYGKMKKKDGVFGIDVGTFEIWVDGVKVSTEYGSEFEARHVWFDWKKSVRTDPGLLDDIKNMQKDPIEKVFPHLWSVESAAGFTARISREGEVS